MASVRANAGLRWLGEGPPLAIRCGNGPEFPSRHFLSGCDERQIRLVFIEPGRPTQSGQVESFNGRFRDECLNANWFLALADARAKVEAWRKEYNSERLHSSLRCLSPEDFAARQMPRGDSTGLIWDQGDSNTTPLPHTPIPAAREGSMTRQDAGDFSCDNWWQKRGQVTGPSTVKRRKLS